MPIHIAGAVAPAAACPAKVSQRNAPGAMSAMAFMVNPVKPNVGFISTASSAIWFFSLGFTESLTDNFFLWVVLNQSRSEVGLHQRGCSSQIGADWLENHRGHGRRLRAPNQSALRSTATTPRNSNAVPCPSGVVKT